MPSLVTPAEHPGVGPVSSSEEAVANRAVVPSAEEVSDTPLSDAHDAENADDPVPPLEASEAESGYGGSLGSSVNVPPYGWCADDPSPRSAVSSESEHISEPHAEPTDLVPYEAGSDVVNENQIAVLGNQANAIVLPMCEIVPIFPEQL